MAAIRPCNWGGAAVGVTTVINLYYAHSVDTVTCAHKIQFPLFSSSLKSSARARACDTVDTLLRFRTKTGDSLGDALLGFCAGFLFRLGPASEQLMDAGVDEPAGRIGFACWCTEPTNGFEACHHILTLSTSLRWPQRAIGSHDIAYADLLQFCGEDVSRDPPGVPRLLGVEHDRIGA